MTTQLPNSPNCYLLLNLAIAFVIAAFQPAYAADAIAKPNFDEAYYGNYRIDDNHLMGIDRFIMDNGEAVVLISDYASGVVRRLFPVTATEFVMGPGFNTAEPAELTVRFSKSKQGAATKIALLYADGTKTFATQIPLHREEVSFEQADAKLKGTLITPASKGPHPAIILLHGSGPLTRYNYGPYPHFFSSLGLAVLIYDKRGTGASTGLRMDASTANVMKPAYYPDDLTKDALAALRFLQQRKDIDPQRIGLWGSSEGGMLTSQVAARAQDIAFAINSSGFMEPLWETLRYQVEPSLRDAGLTNAAIKKQKDFIDLWLNVARTGQGWEEFQKQEEAIIKTEGFWFLQTRGKYTSVEQIRWDWNHVLSFNPLPALEKVTCPVLAVFGELDSATPAERTAENMRRVLTKAGHKDFTIKIFPNAGHSLSEMPSKNRMAPGVFQTLSDWILERVQLDEK
jgi:pimeloyl-ACP methyl ester carboxylesterase